MSQSLSTGGKTFRKILLLFVLVTMASVLWAVFSPQPTQADTPIYVRPGGSDTYCVGIADVDFSPGVVPACAVETLQRAIELAGPNGVVVLHTSTDTITIPLSEFPLMAPEDDHTIVASAVTTLTVTKSSWPNPVQLGTPLTYTVRITNTGSSAATEVSLFDILPSINVVTQPTAISSQGVCNSPDSTSGYWEVNCPLSTLNSGATATVTIVVTPTAAGIINNYAFVLSSNAPLSLTQNDTRVTGVSDLSISKTASPNPVTVNNPLTYTITVTNFGPSAATNITVVDTLPDNVLVGPPPPGCAPIIAGVVTCTITFLDSLSDTVTLTLPVTPTVAGIITNTVTVTGGDTDNIPGNNVVTITTTVNDVVNLGIIKTDSPDPVAAGGSLTYTLLVSNSGPGAADNVTLADNLPAQVSINNASGNSLLLHFNEPSTATTFIDSSGNGYNGTCSNCPTAGVSGKFGSALGFNGTSNFVNLNNPPGLNFAGNITLMAWVNISDTTGIRNIIAHGYTTSPNGAVFLRVNSGNYEIGSWDGVGHLTSYSVGGDAGNWVHLAGVYDGANWRLYRNGVQVNATADATGVITVNENWAIGARGTGTERFFSGLIDEAAIFNRALGASEIAAIYQNQLGGQITSSQGACVATSSVSCNLGTLPNLGVATVTLRVAVTSTAAGIIANTASVTSTQIDSNPANNTDTENTTVSSSSGGPGTVYLPIILKNYASAGINFFWDGLEPVRDKVSPSDGAAGLATDGKTDGVFRLVINMGSETKTVNSVILNTSQSPGIFWDTINGNGSWVAGILNGGVVVNNPVNGTINQTVSGMFDVKLYVSDTDPASLFPPDTHDYTVTIHFTDGTSLSATARIPPTGPILPPPPTGLSSVSDVAADPDTNQIFVAGTNHDLVYVIDGSTDTVDRTVPVGNGPTGLAVLDKVFVAHQYGANTWHPGVKAFGVNQNVSHDTSDGGYVGAAPVKVAANRTNIERIYVSNYFDKLAVIDGSSSPPENRLGWVLQKGFQGAYGIDASAPTNRVYLATRDSGELVVFNGYQDRLLGADYIPTHIKPPQACSLWSVAVNENTGHVFVPCPQLSTVFVLKENQFSVQDLEKLGVLEVRKEGLALVVSALDAPWIAEISIPSGLDLGKEGIAVDPTTGHVFITNARNDTVVVLQDSNTPTYVTTVGLGSGADPQGIDVNPNTGKVYVGNTGHNTVAVLDATTPFSILTTIPLTP